MPRTVLSPQSPPQRVGRSVLAAALAAAAFSGVARSSAATATTRPAQASAVTTATQPAAGGFLGQVTSHFAAWDRDHDGVLSANEIELAVHDPAVQGPAAAAATALRRAVRADSTLKPFTLAQITDYAGTKAAPGRSPTDGTTPRFDVLFDAATKKIAAANKELFPADSPKLDTLGQGRLGDCFLLASLGAVVEADPARLRRLMRPTPDGKVAVSFGDGREMVVQPPTDAELAIGASTRGTGTWANVYELMVGERYLERQKTPRHATPLSIVGVGGSPHTPLGFVTGHTCARLGCEAFQKNDLSPADREAKLDHLRDKLVAAKKAGKLIVGGTGPLSGSQVKVPGLYYNHSYAVLNYDRATDKVSFWNPMGNGFTPKGPPSLEHGYPMSHGRFDCPLLEAVMWFGSFSVETDDAVKP